MGENDDDAFVELFGGGSLSSSHAAALLPPAIAASPTLYKTAKIEGINIF
jgi:hypothetical protein